MSIVEVGILAYQLTDLQLRYSAGLAPASTFTPWHPGNGSPQRYSIVNVLRLYQVIQMGQGILCENRIQMLDMQSGTWYFKFKFTSRGERELIKDVHKGGFQFR